MASFGGYVMMFFGLSLVLGLLGIHTTTTGLVGSIFKVEAFSPTQNYTINSSSLVFNLNWAKSHDKTLLGALYLVLIAVGGIGIYRLIVGGTFGIAETAKTSTALVILGFLVADLYSIFTYVNGIEGVTGNLIRFVIILIYTPLTYLAVTSALDWIGGGR